MEQQAGTTQAQETRSFGETFEQFGEQMAAWGEEFGCQMEAWGQEFGQRMDAWGKEFGPRTESWAEELALKPSPALCIDGSSGKKNTYKSCI